MKIVSAFVGKSSVKKDYVIYENVEEVGVFGIKVVHFDEAKEGDYCRSDNGYYIPVVSRLDKRNLKKPQEVFCTIQFPRWQFSYMKYLNTKSLSRHTFSYPLEPQPNRTKGLSSRMKIVGATVAKGATIYDAMKLAYPKLGSRDREKKLKQLMENDKFVDYLMVKSDMKKLKQALENENVDYEYLAKSLKKLIDKNDGKNSFEAIKFGFNLVNASEKAEELEPVVKEQKSIGDNLFEKKLAESSSH